MRVRSIFVLLAVIAACWRVAVGEEFMEVADIKAGMTGTGKTVFVGDQVEEFGVEILAVLERFSVGSDLIVAKLSGKPLDETGVLGGMSGSPVYIRGKLIGGISYQMGSFPKEPICGIIPISEMLDVFDGGTSSLGEVPPPSRLITIPRIEGLRPFWGRSLAPIKSPLLCSGFDERALRYMEPFLENTNLTLALGGTYPGKGSQDSVSLGPGSSMGVKLMRGDADIATVGTVTHIDGDKVLAFGHPVLGIGSTDLPMTGAWVHSLISSQYRSMKLASATEIVGTIEEDRRSAVAGTLGKHPFLLPLRVTIGGSDYRFELMRDEAWTPLLAGLTTLNSILASAKSAGALTAILSLGIRTKRYPPITMENMISGDRTPLTAAQHVQRQISQVMANSFEKVDLEGVDISISVSEERLTAEIEEVTLGNQRPGPGDTLELLISLRSYQGESTSERVRIPIPEEVPAGTYTVQVVDGISYWADETKRVPLKFKPRSLSELLSILSESPRGNEIHCQLYSASPGATVRGEELPSLPPSVVHTMRSSKQAGREGLTLSSRVADRKIETDFLVSGKAEIEFNLRGK